MSTFTSVTELSPVTSRISDPNQQYPRGALGSRPPVDSTPSQAPVHELIFCVGSQSGDCLQARAGRTCATRTPSS
eukprot:14855928-Heterocapsa_arctica.AAC.1